MFIVAAELTVEPSDHDRFLPHVLENARLTRTTERGCRQFDVNVDPEKRGAFFLYAVYDDRAAFDSRIRRVPTGKRFALRPGRCSRIATCASSSAWRHSARGGGNARRR